MPNLNGRKKRKTKVALFPNTPVKNRSKPDKQSSPSHSVGWHAHVVSVVLFIVVAIRFFARNDLFDSVKSWQITIITMLFSPTLVLKGWFDTVYPFTSDQTQLREARYVAISVLYACFVFLLSGCVSTRWMLGHLCQIVAFSNLHTHFPQRIECCIFVLNALIPFGFWTVMLYSGLCSPDIPPFHHLDRHLREYGPYGTLTSFEGRTYIARECLFHGAAQALILIWLWRKRRILADWSSTKSLQCFSDGAIVFAGWVAMCSICSHDLMPYVNVEHAAFYKVSVLLLVLGGAVKYSTTRQQRGGDF